MPAGLSLPLFCSNVGFLVPGLLLWLEFGFTRHLLPVEFKGRANPATDTVSVPLLAGPGENPGTEMLYV